MLKGYPYVIQNQQQFYSYLGAGVVSAISKITMAVLFVLSSTVILSSVPLATYAQGSDSEQGKPFIVNVQVTNRGTVDQYGTIHISVDGSSVSKTFTNVNFPAYETVSRMFEFNPGEVPVGTGFNVDVVYGEDIFKSVRGVNSPSSTPEPITIDIP
ncbi:MAG: hypothetical protein M3162_03580 [Thermoproteota archaeon]|nr:hypothetical protein [Thermoproteota archaeon]